MSRKHYREFARIIAEAADYMTLEQRRRIASAITIVFRADNHNFDYERFWEASNLNETEETVDS